MSLSLLPSFYIRLYASTRTERRAPRLLLTRSPLPRHHQDSTASTATASTTASFLPLNRCKALRSTPGTINPLGAVQRHLRHNTGVVKDAKRWLLDLTDSLSVCSMMSRSQALEVSASSCRARSTPSSSINGPLTLRRSRYQRTRRCCPRILRKPKGCQNLPSNRRR